MKNSNKKWLMILIFALFLLVITQNNKINLKLEQEQASQNFNMSGSWNLSPFVIDETGFGDYTWAQAVLQPWCSGSGTWSDPYIIENVTISGGGSCIEIQWSTKYFIIRNCTFKGSTSGSGGGIYLYRTNNGTLTNNNCSNNGVGIRVCDNSDNNTISNNILKDNNINGIYLYNGCNDNTIYNNTIEDSTRGIFLNDNCHYNDILENILFNNTGDPIYYESGVHLAVSSNNKIINNIITSAGDYGVYLEATSNYNIILNNTFFLNGEEGLYLKSSGYNNVSENTFANNSIDGVRLYSGSKYNNFWENLFINNSQYGVYLLRYSTQSGYCEYNLFYNNTFINNGEHAFDNGMGPYSDSPPNYWNNTDIGNYWDDYNGADSNDDGIGDIPYDVSPRGKDYLPIWFDGPTLQINLPQEDQIFGVNPPEFNVETHDPNIDTFWYELNVNETKYLIINNGTIEINAWNFLDDGPVLIKFFANDTFGNINSNEVTVIKDANAPVITINSPTPNQLCGISAPTFSLTVNDPNLHKRWYSLNGGQNITLTTQIQISQVEWDKFGNGTVLIRFYANDTIGNMDYSEVLVRKDAYEPLITIHSPISDQTFGTTPPSYSLSIDEQTSVNSWYTIEGVAGQFPFTELSGTIDANGWQQASEGQVTITFYAEDEAGNVGSNEVTIIKELPETIEEPIPGYNVLFLIGFMCITIIIVIRKKHQ